GSPGPRGKSLSFSAEVVWLKSLRFKSLALIAGTAAGGAGKLLDVAEATAGVAAGVAPAGWAVRRWLPAQEVSASPATITPSARKRPLNNNGPPGRPYDRRGPKIGSGDYWVDRVSSPPAVVDQASRTLPRPPRCLPPARRQNPHRWRRSRRWPRPQQTALASRQHLMPSADSGRRRRSAPGGIRRSRRSRRRGAWRRGCGRFPQSWPSRAARASAGTAGSGRW